MKREELPIQLFRPSSPPGHYEAVDGVLIRGLSRNEVLEAAESWQIPREELRRELDRAGVQPDADEYPESLHWDWFEKLLRNTLGRPEPHLFSSVKVGGRWEGLLLTKMGEQRRARLLPDEGQRLVYGDFMETAVWNMSIPTLAKAAELVGVGAVFMREIIEESVVLGWNGRVGLHSLPKAERRYQKWKMTKLGRDPDYQGLAYFEFTADQASEFLKGRI